MVSIINPPADECSENSFGQPNVDDFFSLFSETFIELPTTDRNKLFCVFSIQNALSSEMTNSAGCASQPQSGSNEKLGPREGGSSSVKTRELLSVPRNQVNSGLNSAFGASIGTDNLLFILGHMIDLKVEFHKESSLFYLLLTQFCQFVSFLYFAYNILMKLKSLKLSLYVL